MALHGRRALLPLPLLLAAHGGQAQPRGVTLSPTNASIGFRLTVLGLVPIEGQFRSFTGEARVDPTAIATARLALVIDTASADTGDTTIDADLRGPGLFDVARFPRAFFETVRVLSAAQGAAGQAKSPEAQIEGWLTIKDVRRLERFALTIEPGRPMRLLASGTILRSAYGLSGRRRFVADEARLTVEARLPPA